MLGSVGLIGMVVEGRYEEISWKLRGKGTQRLALYS